VAWSSSMPRRAGLPPVCETASSWHLRCASPSSQGSNPGRVAGRSTCERGRDRRDRDPASPPPGGERAVALLPTRPDLVLLDGNYDWFTRPERSTASPAMIEPGQVRLKVKADVTCASVAAASVIAKVARDRLMVELARSYPWYGWHANKGYAAPEHRAALLEMGPCEEHRRSWHLLVAAEPTTLEGAEPTPMRFRRGARAALAGVGLPRQSGSDGSLKRRTNLGGRAMSGSDPWRQFSSVSRTGLR